MIRMLATYLGPIHATCMKSLLRCDATGMPCPHRKIELPTPENRNDQPTSARASSCSFYYGKTFTMYDMKASLSTSWNIVRAGTPVQTTSQQFSKLNKAPELAWSFATSSNASSSNNASTSSTNPVKKLARDAVGNLYQSMIPELSVCDRTCKRFRKHGEEGFVFSSFIFYIDVQPFGLLTYIYQPGCCLLFFYSIFALSCRSQFEKKAWILATIQTGHNLKI